MTKHRISRLAAAALLLFSAAACSGEAPRLPTDNGDPRRPPRGGQSYVAPAELPAQYA